eukprot:CAMPEP_0184324166 /NCGR_PEP_ID=MMETSP1049-20130417/133860_1 /TAXON_ID=77928 /ORGANISM="Proteomonas sulcata, Strain CCMP704" /LENGTH=193 /DNA_ID=CAMNT_0026645871 /DNA_START=502 /DNA_END=1084 /DNA_ORIENTATION=-
MEPVTFSVPRKGDQFQGDLYPDTFAGKAALKSKEWFDGNNAAPVLMSMNPNDTSVRAVVKEQGQAVNLAGGGGGRGSSAGAGISAPAPAPEAGIDAASKAMLSRLEKKVASLEEENKKLKAEAEESDRLKGLVEELQSKNSRLEAQIAKMGKAQGSEKREEEPSPGWFRVMDGNVKGWRHSRGTVMVLLRFKT